MSSGSAWSARAAAAPTRTTFPRWPAGPLAGAGPISPIERPSVGEVVPELGSERNPVALPDFADQRQSRRNRVRPAEMIDDARVDVAADDFKIVRP